MSGPEPGGDVVQSAPDGRLVPLVKLTITKGWLTMSVILGFVVGALLSSVLNISDRFAPQLVMLIGSVGAGLANLGLIWADGVEAALIGIAAMLRLRKAPEAALIAGGRG